MVSLPQRTSSLIENPESYRPTRPLAELLRSIRLTGVIQAKATLTAPWGVSLPHPPDTVLLYFIDEGACYIKSGSYPNGLRLSAGDIVILLQPSDHVVADKPETPAVPLNHLFKIQVPFTDDREQLLTSAFQPFSAPGGGGAETVITTLRMYIDERFPKEIFNSVDEISILKGFLQRSNLYFEALLRQIREHGSRGFIGQIVATRLGEAVLIECVKEHLEQDSTKDSVIHRALKDPFISKVIGKLQRNPENEWGIQFLAKEAGLSRSAFLARFRLIIGSSPGQFQVSLRVKKAHDLIVNSNLSLGEIALLAGYSSEAAFNRAFRRQFGSTPGSLRKATHEYSKSHPPGGEKLPIAE